MAAGVEPSENERYWWACGPDGWGIETWRGEPAAENVALVGYAKDLVSADALVAELNAARNA